MTNPEYYDILLNRKKGGEKMLDKMKWKTGWILSGLMGSSEIHVFRVQYRGERGDYIIEVPHLFGPMRWRDVIYTSRLHALKAQREELRYRLEQLDEAIDEAEGET